MHGKIHSSVSPEQIVLTAVLKSLNPTKVYPGHVARGVILDGHTDIDYSLAYLRYFHKNVLEQEGKIPPKEIYDSLRREFPDAIGNLEFLLNRTAENFGISVKVKNDVDC
jgi:hypothetical protein